MAASRRWEWDKQGDFDGHANFHRELPAGVVLSNPTAELHKLREGSKPPRYDDVTDQVTIAASVVHALRRAGSTFVEETGGASRGIRVVITADADPQPDSEDEPVPYDGYRVMLIVTRSDSVRPLARPVPFVIHP